MHAHPTLFQGTLLALSNFSQWFKSKLCLVSKHLKSLWKMSQGSDFHCSMINLTTTVGIILSSLKCTGLACLDCLGTCHSKLLPYRKHDQEQESLYWPASRVSLHAVRAQAAATL